MILRFIAIAAGTLSAFLTLSLICTAWLLTLVLVAIGIMLGSIRTTISRYAAKLKYFRVA